MCPAGEPGSAGGLWTPPQPRPHVVAQTRRSTSEPQDFAAGDRVRQDAERPVLVGTKLHPPTVREQTIPRERLLERLRSGSDRRLTLVACPAGFGKTTLLAAWCQAEAARKPVAWLTLDEGDNDPAVLWSYALEALRRAVPAAARPAPAHTIVAPVVDVVLPRLVNELDGQGEVALILDDFHRLSSVPARASVQWFIDHAPAGFQLVLATRMEPLLPAAALRAHGELLELRADDLRFTSEEADAFLNGRLGLDLAPEDVEDIVGKTEGWPAGLYLAALSLQHAADRRAFVRRFGASNRHVLDFLVTEVLEPHEPPMQELMLRTSILERLHGPLCDAVLEQQDSAGMLNALSRTNLFLVPLDDEGGWYRFHHLFAQLLRVELERREPGLVPALHRRAYAWHRDHGTTEEAIQHALAAEAYAEAAQLIEACWFSYKNSYRYATILAWLRRLPDEILGGDVQLLLIQAWVLSLSAKREEAALAIAAVERLGDHRAGPRPAGFSSVEAALTMLPAVFSWGDIGAQLENARRAIELEPAGSLWWPVACWAMGFGLYFHGEFGEAERWFTESAALAPARGQWIVAGSSLAYCSLIAGQRGRLEEQRALAEQAMELVQERGIGEVDGEAPLALGVSLAARGKPGDALPLIERAIVVLRSWGQPIDLASALLGEAPVLRTLGEHKRAADAVAEARSLVESCPDPGILAERLAALDRPPRMRGVRSGDQELTQRELRVLKLLYGDLSERDIGRELFVSHSTVHSHVRAIYRKLAVSSRAGALKRGRELGLFSRASKG